MPKTKFGAKGWISSFLAVMLASWLVFSFLTIATGFNPNKTLLIEKYCEGVGRCGNGNTGSMIMLYPLTALVSMLLAWLFMKIGDNL